jgi:hypothetical protein
MDAHLHDPAVDTGSAPTKNCGSGNERNVYTFRRSASKGRFTECMPNRHLRIPNPSDALISKRAHDAFGRHETA